MLSFLEPKKRKKSNKSLNNKRIKGEEERRRHTYA
jgi:hypothetical protein